MGYKPNTTILCIIGQEKDEYAITVDYKHEICETEFYIKDYLKGFYNSLNLKKFYKTINEECEESDFISK